MQIDSVMDSLMNPAAPPKEDKFGGLWLRGRAWHAWLTEDPSLKDSPASPAKRIR